MLNTMMENENTSFANDFIFIGSFFHILGPRAAKLLTP